jgi:Uma2 family endonuclease
MGSPASDLNNRYTYREYREWDDTERWELIDGHAYNMTLAPSRVHQEICGELFRQFANFLTDKACRVYSAPFDVRLPEGNEADDDIVTVVQPDLSIVCDRTKLDDKGCKGSPDLIIEVISPSTARKDLKEKLPLYEKAGVREYWIVDQAAKTVMVFRQNESTGFGRPDIYTEEDRIEVGIFPDLIIDLGAVFRE